MTTTGTAGDAAPETDRQGSLRWVAASVARTAIVASAMAAGAIAAGPAVRPGVEGGPTWRADHHMHVASVDLCARVGECRELHEPAAVYGADLVRALDQGSVAKGLVLSGAYLYGLADLGLDGEAVARWTRRENEFTAGEVAAFPDRLVGFLSVDPLEPSALDEIRHWRGDCRLVGLKVHFTASGVDLADERHRARIAEVVAEVAAADLPLVVHLGGGDFDGTDAETFVRTILPAAGDSWVQIAHAGGGLPLVADHHAQVLRVFADHFADGDPAVRRVLFDLSFVPHPDEGPDAIAALVDEMRRIGFDRFLFGSDFDIGDPGTAAAALGRLGLTAGELSIVRGACAPWICGDPPPEGTVGVAAGADP